MATNFSLSETDVNNDVQEKLVTFLDNQFDKPDPENLAKELLAFVKEHPLALEDYPRSEGHYTRTVILRHESGFEAMVARWSKGTVSPIHGHPWFNLYCVVHGCLAMDDYLKKEGGLSRFASGELYENEVSFFIGEKGRFDNNIHKVHAREETLSIHISSDDATKGEVFD